MLATWICIGKNIIYVEVQYYLWFQASVEGLGTYPPQLRGKYCIESKMPLEAFK